MKCPTCDTTVEPGIAFCPNCGTRITQPSSAGSQTILLPDQPDDTPRVEPAQGATILLRDVPPPAPSPPAPLPLDPPAAPSAFGLPPASAPPPYTPPAPLTGPTYAPYAPSAGYNAPVVLPTSTAAIVSLVCGILSYMVIPLIGAIAAVVAGHMARREIRDSNGQIGGGGLATAGLILGYLHLALVALAICAFVAIFVLAAVGSSTAR